MYERVKMCLFINIAVFFVGVQVSTGQLAPTKELNDGNRIPVVGLGTFGSAKDKARMRQTINLAVEAGYRHIDTAALYDNERMIGEGIKDVINRGIVKREDLFVTTKLWNNRHAGDQVVPALRESLQKLDLDYVDLYLMHEPNAENADGTPSDIDYLETWAGMEEAQRLGLTNSIGVSNFNIEQFDRLIVNSNVTPAVNEIEVNPTNTNRPLAEHCLSRGVAVVGYSPFGFLVSREVTDAPPPRADDPALVAIARKYGKTTSQVVLRYQIDRDIIPIPKSTNKQRLEENIDIFDFQLTPEEISTIDSFNVDSAVLNWIQNM